MTATRFLLLPLLCLAASAADPKTVWDGVYTAAQASRGGGVYAAECGACHKADLSGYRGLLLGERFMDDWREDHLGNFFAILQKTMPRNAPGSLTPGEYVDIIAYILQTNTFPAGAAELKAADLGMVRVEAKEGPQPVPNYALVQVTGCLVQGATGDWMLTAATEPRRTRNPGDGTPEELQSLEARPVGTQTFRLLDATAVRGDPPRNHRVGAKGFLMRKPGADSINITALQALGGACAL